MSATAISQGSRLFQGWNFDRLGVGASILCAIHCAVTPILLMFLPVFGEAWAHPATHWGMALIVVPVAGFTLFHGFQSHRKKWVLSAGIFGIFFVLLGAVVPYLEKDFESETAHAATISDQESENAADSEDEFVYHVGQEEESEGDATAADEAEACTDRCCPSLVTDSDGNTKLHIPPASIITTLGGLALIVTHIGNICCCPSCDSRSRKKSSK